MTKRKPEAIELDKPTHRVVVLRAFHALLSKGSDETEARRGAVRYALEHWSELAD